ncbi:hypothetical protein [Aquabacterium sp.]|uniref:hypothetical protein n=1 Tax=Aquabacterium sp. TaxID=1872578 RepID=UPI0035B2A82D
MRIEVICLRRSVLNLMGLLIVVLIYGALASEGLLLREADYAASYGRQVLFQWDSDSSSGVSMAAWRAARKGTERAIELLPSSPVYQDQLAYLYILRARQTPDQGLSKIFYSEAANRSLVSLKLRPQHGWAWAMYAEELSGLGLDPCDAMVQAKHRAPYEMGVASVLQNRSLNGMHCSE